MSVKKKQRVRFAFKYEENSLENLEKIKMKLRIPLKMLTLQEKEKNRINDAGHKLENNYRTDFQWLVL